MQITVILDNLFNVWQLWKHSQSGLIDTELWTIGDSSTTADTGHGTGNTRTQIFLVYTNIFLYLGIHPDFHASKNQANNSDQMVLVPYCPGLGLVTSLVCAPLSATSQDSTRTQSVRWPGTVQLTVTLDREPSRNIVKGQRIFGIIFNNLQKEALSFWLFLEDPCCAAPHESPAPARSRTGPWL